VIKEILYDNIRTIKEKRQPAADDALRFGPSSALSCARQLYYYKSGEARTEGPDPHSELVMGLGTWLHNAVAELVSRGHDVQREVEAVDDTWRGFVDLIVDGTPVEIKTVYGYGAGTEPKESWVAQLGIYMSILGKGLGYILQLDRGNGHLEEWEVARAGSVVRCGSITVDLDLLTDRAKWIKESIKAGKIPDREYTINLKKTVGGYSDNFTRNKEKIKSAWQCRFCGWYSRCWGDLLAEFQQSSSQFVINGVIE
jgi:hypothetical protein